MMNHLFLPGDEISVNGTYAVYWIHLKDQADPFLNGYVGVSNDVERRFKRHQRHADLNDSKRNKFPLYRAFRKFGISEFLFEVLVSSLDSWSAHNLEYVLRPHKNIGLNIAPGGFLRSSLLCSSLSPSTKKQESMALIAEHIEMARRRCRNQEQEK